MKIKGIKNNKVAFVALIIFVITVAILTASLIIRNKNKNDIKEIQEYTPKVKTEVEKKESTEILKVKELQKQNADVKGWIKIADTIIDYPLLQGSDNEYYLKHDYKKEYSKYGSIYLKDQCDINNVNSNLIIYGHNMKDKEMFNSLLKYEDKDFYQAHKTINITTDSEDREYEIVSVFKSRVFYQEEKNVFRYYNYINFKDENEYNEYMSNVYKIQLYETGVTAEYGEQLLTLITCEYSQENGRMVVIAKRVK